MSIRSGWLHHVRCLQIPIPPGTTPSEAELKDWAMSRTRVDARWIRHHPGDLVVHSSETNAEIVDLHLVPGTECVVLLHCDRDVRLDKIEIGSYRQPGLRGVARYEEPRKGDAMD